MKCKHLALLLLASNFLLTSVPALAELEDAPLPGDFQSAQPARQPKPAVPAPQPIRTEKPQASAAPVSARPVGLAESSHKKRSVSRSKAPRKATVSLKSGCKAVRIKHHAVVARRAGATSVKAGKKARLAGSKHEQAKHLKKVAAPSSKKVEPARKVRSVSKKPLKTVKKKVSTRKSKK